MRLWTIQPKELYLELMNKGYITCNPELAPDLIDGSFVDAYTYMVSLMESSGIKKPDTVDFPLWAWYKYDWKHKKPDLRQSCFGRHGDKMLCIEIEVPDNEVLLTDFNAWHSVLNRGYLDNSLSEEEFDAEQEWFDNLPSWEIKEAEMIKSWERIKNIDEFENNWLHRGRFVQATFFILKRENIVRVQEFTCR